MFAEVEESDDLYIYIGKFNGQTDFGKLVYYKEYKGLFFGHALLGDYLDKEELLCAISWVMKTADMIDDELQELFGGKRFIDIIK